MNDDDAAIVARALANDPTAFGELYDRWFDRVLDLAYRIVLDTGTAADVAHDTFLAAYRNLGRLEDPSAFGGWLLRIARNRAIDRYRATQLTQSLDQATATSAGRPSAERAEDVIGTFTDPARVADDASFAALLWDAVDALGARDREVLDLSLRHGLSPSEVGHVLGVSDDTAHQFVQRALLRLGPALEARVLWRDGAPTCAALRADLIAADVETFDGEAVRVIDRHAAGCRECTERAHLQLDAADLFAAVPLLAIPELRTKTAYGLAEAGVPMQGSHAFDGGPPPPSRPPGGRRRTRRWVIAGSAAGIIVIIALIVAAGARGHSPNNPVVIVAKSTTTSSSSSTSTSTSSSTSTTSTSTTTTVPVTVAPTTTTTVAPAVAVFKLAPASVEQGYATTTSAGPVLTWNTSGLARLAVYDASKVFNRTGASGSSVVCPGVAQTSPSGTCTANPGHYVYTLDGFDGSNNLIVHRTVTLTITAPGP